MPGPSDGALALGRAVSARRARLIAEASAARAQQAAAARRRQEEERQRSYAAAQINRLTADWYAMLLSADNELRMDARRLRGAARTAVRDTPFATRYVNLISENVIGPHGIQLQAKVRTTRGTLNTRLNTMIEEEWENWSHAETASASGRLSWQGIQDLLIRTLPQDGEFVLRLVRGATDNPYLFSLQPIDVDLLDDQLILDSTKTPDGNEIRMGVEIDKHEKPVAFWMWTRHPTDIASVTSRRRIRVPADEILHDYVTLRPGQTRGVTWFAPVLINSQSLAAYIEASITAARVAASNMAAVEIDPDKTGASFAAVQPGQQATQAPGSQTIPVEVEPGRFLRLGPGEKLVNTNFDQPNAMFGDFVKYSSRTLAAGLNVAYSSLSGDLESVNYSSIRAGIISERDFFRRLQGWMAERVCRRVFAAWLPYAVLAGRLPADAFQILAQPRAQVWRGRGWQWVDPRNDIEATHLEVALGLTSRTQVAAEHGGDFEQIIEQLAEEQRIASEAGVSINPVGLTVKGEDPNTDSGGDAATAEGAGKPGVPPARGVRLIRGQ